MRLKSRSNSPPNGFTYKQKETGWENRVAVPSSQWDFNLLVQSVREHRLANPRFNLTTDMTAIADEVDQANAFRVSQMEGAESYIVGDAPPPKTVSPQQQSQISAAGLKAKKIWSGLKSLNEWYESGEGAVPADQSSARAKTCSECPLNEQGDFEKWFTRPAAEAIKKLIAKFSDKKLTTPYDDRLFTCRACLCPNALSCHSPIQIKISHMSDEVFNELKTAPNCWVVKEAKALGRT